MLGFGNHPRAGQEQGAAELAAARLGKLEAEVMAALWREPARETSVRDLLGQLAQPRAYTTVMTTLDRLFKKGLLLRRKADRAFLYTPRCSRQEWESERAGAMVQQMLAAPGAAHGLVLATLVAALGPGQEALLTELEAKIQAQREALRAAGAEGAAECPRPREGESPGPGAGSVAAQGPQNGRPRR